MLSIEDCIAMSELTPEEIEAIAQHEHIPVIVAAELGNYLVSREGGCIELCRIILDDIKQAYDKGDVAKAAKLRLTLKKFLAEHALPPSASQTH